MLVSTKLFCDWSVMLSRCMARSVVVLLSRSKMTWLNITQSSSSMGVVVPVNVKTISLCK